MSIAPFSGHALVGVEAGTGDGDDDGIDVVRHGTSTQVTGRAIGPWLLVRRSCEICWAMAA